MPESLPAHQHTRHAVSCVAKVAVAWRRNVQPMNRQHALLVIGYSAMMYALVTIQSLYKQYPCSASPVAWARPAATVASD